MVCASKGPMEAKACREASLVLPNLRWPGLGREQQWGAVAGLGWVSRMVGLDGTLQYSFRGGDLRLQSPGWAAATPEGSSKV